jgi:uncharacterized repeat protein (TIGR03803 family)
MALAAGALLASAPSASAYTYKVIHDFCKKLQCGDGQNPIGNLVADQAGNLYGTADGGAHNSGIVFELAPPAPGTKKWKYRVLYNFCDRPNCLDGNGPRQASLIVDTAGNLYGTTESGGPADNDGTVFRLTPNAKRSRWALTTIYSFCFVKNDCADGRLPEGGLTYVGAGSGVLYDGVSPLYGTATGGGRHFGGVAYSLAPTQQGKWAETVLYAFCAVGGVACTDGANPFGQLAFDATGNLFGTTFEPTAGVVFKLSPQLGEQRWTETVLHAFCSQANCADGSTSYSGLVSDAAGNMYGTALGDAGFSAGVVYRVTAAGDYSVLYSFCAQANCVDGYFPRDQGGLSIDQVGNLYGTTNGGGKNDAGTIFELSGATLSVLKSFCPKGNCTGGGAPGGGLLQDSSGNLFGTTGGGGRYSGGVVFELSP